MTFSCPALLKPCEIGFSVQRRDPKSYPQTGNIMSTDSLMLGQCSLVHSQLEPKSQEAWRKNVKRVYQTFYSPQSWVKHREQKLGLVLFRSDLLSPSCAWLKGCETTKQLLCVTHSKAVSSAHSTPAKHLSPQHTDRIHGAGLLLTGVC